MINTKKKLSIALVCTALISLIVATTSSAAASTSYSLGGYTASGSISFGTNSASGSTSFGTSSGISVSVTYYYKHGSINNTYNVTSNQSAASTSVSTTASATSVPSVHVSAEGKHTVVYNGGTWTGYTDI